MINIAAKLPRHNSAILKHKKSLLQSSCQRQEPLLASQHLVRMFFTQPLSHWAQLRRNSFTQSPFFSFSSKENDSKVDEVQQKESQNEEFKQKQKKKNDQAHKYALFHGKKLIISNYKSSKSDEVQTIQIDGQNQKVTQITDMNRRKSISEWTASVKERVIETYLPADYPDSVTSQYLPFTAYSCMGSVCVTAMMFLSTQSLFVALGGSATQSQLAAAAYTWVLKDGIGQLGGILFASRYGSNFDEDIKKWRFLALFALNLSIYIEIMTLKFPQHFLALASLANVGKNICFLLAAASRASINLRFAKQNNVGDIAGKAVSQFTTTSLLGMALGTLLTKCIDISSIPHLVPTFLGLSAINMFTAYKTAGMIDEVNLNNARASLLFNAYFKLPEDQRKDVQNLPTMEQINKQEQFMLPNMFNLQRCRYIRFGEKAISRVLAESKPNYFTTSVLHQLHKAERGFVYHVSLLPHYQRFAKRFINNNREYIIDINMRQECTNTDQLRAYFFARLLDIELQKLFEQRSVGTDRVSYEKKFQNIQNFQGQFTIAAQLNESIRTWLYQNSQFSSSQYWTLSPSASVVLPLQFLTPLREL